MEETATGKVRGEAGLHYQVDMASEGGEETMFSLGWVTAYHGNINQAGEMGGWQKKVILIFGKLILRCQKETSSLRWK